MNEQQSAEYRVKALIGELQVRNIVLATELEAMTAKAAALEAELKAQKADT